jgi:uncharacterized protein (DUF4415 family)
LKYQEIRSQNLLPGGALKARGLDPLNIRIYIKEASPGLQIENRKKESSTMSGSQQISKDHRALMAAIDKSDPSKDYVWDGADEDDRPFSNQELTAGLEAYRKSRGRPAGSGKKEAVAIRLDHEVLEVFRNSGPGWQTRINEVLLEWVKRNR